MFNINSDSMRFNTMTKTDTYYEFVGDNGLKLIMPLGNVILVDDNSGLISIKLVSTRKTIGTVRKNN